MEAAWRYDGLEIAPYTLSDEPHRMGAAQIAAARSMAQDCGVAVTGLHWLLVKPVGLSISARDDAVRARTVDVMRALIDLCAQLGGKYLVHGSPQQRGVEAGETRAAAMARARDCFAAVAQHAQAAGVVYCIEPLQLGRAHGERAARRARRALAAAGPDRACAGE